MAKGILGYFVLILDDKTSADSLVFVKTSDDLLSSMYFFIVDNLDSKNSFPL